MTGDQKEISDTDWLSDWYLYHVWINHVMAPLVSYNKEWAEYLYLYPCLLAIHERPIRLSHTFTISRHNRLPSQLLMIQSGGGRG